MDKALNVETINKDNILVDFDPPRLIVQRFKLGLYRMKFVGFAIDKTSKIDKIEFYLDDVLQKAITEKPYEWVWYGLGKHSVEVKVFDKAGNSVSKIKSTTYFQKI